MFDYCKGIIPKLPEAIKPRQNIVGKGYQLKNMKNTSVKHHKGFFRTYSREALTSILIVFLIALSFLACSEESTNPSTTNTDQSSISSSNKTSTETSKSMPIPEETLKMEIKDLKGETFRLSDYAGKLLIVDIWATWCQPCRLEVPHLVELTKEFGPKGVEIVGLTLEDPVTDAEAVADFAKEFKINYRIGWAPQELAYVLMGGSNAIPQTIVISPESKIIDQFRGFHPQITPRKLRNAIESQIKG
jgi:thiol-disulfide isomerase/thioredoxin